MKKRIAGLILAVLMAASVLGGCAAGKVDASKYATTVIATLDGEPIYMDELNYYVRAEQYANEKLGILESYEIDKWTDEVNFYNIFTYIPADSLRENSVVSVRQIYVLCKEAEKAGVTLTDEEKAAVNAAVNEFLAESDEALLSAVNLSADRLKEIYTRNALANKMYAHFSAGVDTTVSDEEACQYDVSYLYISSATIIGLKLEDEEMTPETFAKQIAEKVNAGEDLVVALKNYDLEPTSTTMGDGDNESTYGPTVEGLAVGEAAAVAYGTEGAYYLVVRDSDFNEEATEEKKAEMAQDMIDEAFAETYAEWEAAHSFEPEYKVIDSLVIEDPIYVAPETEASTAAAE